MKRFVLALVAAVVMTACSAKVDWAATGGSRADGVVRLAYEIGEFQTAELNEYQAVDLATRRCQTWGYTGAEAFGGVTRQCNQWGGLGGCARWIVTKEFQCTGTGTQSGQLIGPAPMQQPIVQQQPVAVGTTVSSPATDASEKRVERDPSKRCESCGNLTVP